MMNTEMSDKAHELVRDLFLFSTFTVVALMRNMLYINEVQGRKTKLVTI